MLKERIKNVASVIPEIKTKEAVTHGGTFHADDVLSAALLKIVCPDIKIRRIYSVPTDFKGVVFDVGGGRYDHHNQYNESRCGVPYAAFGKLWRDIGPLLIKEWKKFDASFVQKIDFADNTGKDFPTISMLIAAYNGDADNEKEQNERFFKAVDMIKELLEAYLILEIKKEKAAGILSLEYKKQGHIIVLDKYIPHDGKDIPPNVRFLIFPCRDGYMAKVCPGGKQQILFPVEWRGKREELSQIPGLLFCHTSGKMITAETQADAVRICKQLCKKKSKTVDVYYELDEEVVS